MTHTRPIIIVVLLTAGAGVGARAYYGSRDADAVKVTTAAVTRGDVAEVVAAAGTLQAVTTVQVGTQVSGTVAWLGADFNSIVRKGQIVARLDPSLFETQVEQARANLTRASAEVENAAVKVADAQQKYERAEELAAKELIARSELDAARVAVDLAEATMRSTRAQVTQAEAAVNQAQLNLANTVIAAPIDGIVIGRSVDVGQTVAASLSSPTVFSIAADLAEMQVNASIDESDIGRIRPAQPVTFQVDAYPDDRFSGTVSQVRLQPTVVQNVTTYSVIVDVPNAALKLKPGMTANVTIEIAGRENVVRVPNAALRFRPTAEIFDAIREPAAAGTLTSDPAAVVRAGGAAPAGKRAAADQAATIRGAGAVAPPSEAERDRTATTIDALFGPITTVETEGRVWLYENGQLTAIAVRLGVSDGQTTEVIGGILEPDTALVTSISAGTVAATATANAARSLFMPRGGGG